MDKVEEKKTENSLNISKVKAPPRTVGSQIGEIVWLLGQDRAHRHLSIADLEWLIYPPIMLKQFKMFRDKDGLPIGLALWTYLDKEAEEKFIATGKVGAQDWHSKPEEMSCSYNLWLVDVLCPFSNKENNIKDKIIESLKAGPLGVSTCKMLAVNARENERVVIEL